MRRKWIYASQIAISLVIVMGLAIGCEPSPSTSTTEPKTSVPPSEYPADISGHVIIAEKVKCLTAIAVPPNKDSDVFWIVDITVRNNAYPDPVKASFQDFYKRWEIIANDKVYRPRACGSKTEPLSLAEGERGQFMLHFSIPKTVHISDAQIRYQGQEPYSYGKLSGGDKVIAYDWGSKKVVQGTGDSGELYVVPDEHFKTSNKRLRTVERWTGTESRVIEFDIDKSPWVINGSYEVVSSLGHNFEYLIFTEDEYSVPEDALRRMLGHEMLMPIRFSAGDHYLVKQSGKFVIAVYASGVKWELKVGVE